MANIKVNPSKLNSTAQTIDSKVKSIKGKMSKAVTQVSVLSSSWSGKDYTSFKSQWDKTSDTSATYTKMIKGLESYSNYLKYAAQKYNKAQSDAKTRANTLPRW